MVAKNIIAPIVKEEFYKNSISSTNLLSSKVTSFTNFLGIGNNYNYLPNYIETKRSLEANYARELTFIDYSPSGNPTQFVDRSGITTLLTYYEGLGKNNLLKTKTTGIITTTYDYYPLIGLSKVTDPNGKYMTYEYDALNRLKSISDQNGKLKSYTYHYGSQSATDNYEVVGAAALAPVTLDCEAECRVEAYAKPIAPITNCTAGQFTLDANSSSTGTDITYKWAGPGQYVSNTKSPTISGNLTNYAGVYTLTVTRNNSNCTSTASATTEVTLDCNCPFVINTNGSSSGTLSCYQTISLVSNCQGCSTGDVAPGTETFVNNGSFSNGDVDFSCDAANRFVTTNPVNIVGSFNSFGDHTFNIPYNNMLLVGHSDNREEKVWYRSMTVKPNTRYILSAWVAGAYNNNPTKVFFELGGVSLNETVDLATKSGGQWTQLKSVWTSGDQTSIVLAIRKINTQGHNWFCLDDISMTEAPISEFTWSGPNGFNANGKNQFVRNVALKNGGDYLLTVKDNGCVRKINVPVSVNCVACSTPFIVSTKTNSPVSCGSPITFQTSSSPGVSYEWYSLNSDGSTTPFPATEINKKNPSLSAPVVIGTNRYGYEVQARKDGCTASYTTAVEVKCEPSGNPDLSLRLFKNSAPAETVSTNEVFPICAEIKNESNQPVFSVTAKIKLPDCLTYYGSPWGLNTGGEPNTGGYYEDTWYNPATREVSNISVPNRGGNAWQYWGVPIGPNQSRYMCFYVQSSANTTVLIKGEIAGMETQYHQNMRDADSTPNNGYDNGEDDRSVLKLNPLVNQLEITKYQIFAPNTASTDVFDVIATNTTWTSVNSNTDWIQLNNVTGNSGTTNMVVSFTENLSAKPRYGTITFKAACGLGEVVQIRQAGRDDCPSIDVSSNNPLCGDSLKLFSSIVPAANKDLVTNGNFEKGNVDFNPEAFHVYNSQTGGTNAYTISANPKSENGNTGLWFLNKECQPENTNPVCTIVNRVRLLHRTDCCFERMNGATIQGSNNNGIWDVLYTFGNATGGWQDITLSNTKKYSYIRYVEGPNGYGELMSLEFYNGTTKLSGTPIGSAGTWNSNIPAYGFQNALDNNDGSLWHGISPGSSNYVGYELNNCGTVPDLASNAGAGKQMAVVASWRQRDYFWSQTINVDPSTNYTISAKAVLLGTYDAVPVKLIFEVDGREVNIASDLSTYGCNWKKISGTWNSGEKFGPVKLSIRFENPNSSEKAFAIDDISVKPVQQGSTSNGALSYVWTGPAGAFSGLEARTVLPNPTLPNANAAKAGKYTLTVTQNGCPATESTDVAVGCNSTSCPAPSISTSYGVICANMNQSTTLTAVGCAVGSTVKWSDGQTGATINTGQIKNSTVYTAQCVNACGASIKSNEVTVHVLPMPNPPTILGASTIYVSPGANGITLTATGCPNGTIRWNDGSAGLQAFVPANLNLGTILTYSSRCITECGTSDKSNEVRIVVECDAVEPTASITQFQPCTVDGGLVKMAANCPVGQAVWYDEANAKVNTGNVFEKAIFSNNETKFKVRCELTGLCISDFAWVLIPPNLKPARPYISSAPANPENPLNVSIGVNSTISISSSCPTGTVTNWNLAGYSPSNPTGQYISLTPTSAGIITATATCTIGTCVSDVSMAMIINVVAVPNCTANQFVVSPGDVTVTRTDGGYLLLTATTCLGNVTWKDEEKQLVNTKTFSLAESVILNVPTSVVGVFKYVAECKPANVATCPSSITRTITVIPSTCNLAVSTMPTANCSYTDFVAAVTKAGSAYANVDYQWYYRTSAGGTAYEIVNNANNFRAEDSGERWYFAKAVDKSDGCVATSADVNVKVLKPTDLPTIVSSLSVEANNLIKVNKAGTLNLTVAGCPAFSTPSWLVTDPTGVLSTTAYTGNSIALTGFLKTDDFKVKVKCVSGSSACETNFSNEFTVKVIDLNCDVTIDNFKGDATNPAKTTANGNITLNASGCSNGTITWYLGATSLGTGTSVVVNKPIGTYTFVASCSKGSGCTDQTTIEFSCAGPPVLSYNAPTTKVCQGQSIQLKAAGCIGGTVTWYNGNNTLGTGEFLTTSLPRVSAKCNIGSCTSIETFIETQDDIDLQSLIIFPNCDMNVLTVTPDATGNTYEWKKGDLLISTAKTNQLNINDAGNYSVTVKNGACSKATSFGVNSTNKLYPTVSVTNPSVNCISNSNNKTYNLTSTIGQNTNFGLTNTYNNWRINGDTYWTFVNGVKTAVTSPNCTSKSYGNTFVSDNYELFVTNEYKYANNTKTLTCQASASVNVTNTVTPTPTINSNATCFPTNGSTTLTATNCTAGKINWFKDGFPIAGTSLNLSVNSFGSYSAKCVGVNCLGAESNAITLSDCSLPRCTSPFSDISGTNQLYNQTFTYANTPGSQTRNIQVTFDAYCVPDNLIIYKVTASGETVLVNSGCMGSGIVGSTNNVRTKTFTPFSIAPGETIRVTVGPVPCGASNCQDAVTAWSVSFTCIPAN
jgi:YD repeat-containing protein